MRRRTPRVSSFAAGLTLAIVVAVVSFLVFTKDIPFTQPFQLKAAFENTSNLQTNSPVRIAGVEVGKVARIESAGDDTTAAVVTMNIQDKGLPIYRDAKLKVRPRIFLEGNFFVDLAPGTPGAAALESGQTVPMAQTSAPVQLDQVLTALQKDTRRQLQTSIKC